MLVMLVMLGRWSCSVGIGGWHPILVLIVLGGSGSRCDTLPDLPHVDRSDLHDVRVVLVLLAIGWAGATLGQSNQLGWISMQLAYDSGRRAGT